MERGIDILDLHRGRMSWRRLRVLLTHLPPESHTMTALRNSMSDEELAAASERSDPEKARWSQEEQLLAGVIDAVRLLDHTLKCVNTEKKSKQPEPPEPIKRPLAKKPKKKTQPITEEGAETLFRLINGGAA